ncbi:ParB/RepB/Spo0J family partition protein [Lachnotalea sp. AF33-28]|uniref:ParB/RepB/Spo0J family partition protein n=1 Tax=Lachnotalea sp. AF33-28 TaxID=2292046 RepID=UPI000E4CE585|nr:ParB/RepB/Spo0J family partition protein [Lachnotalea sp. AF33-28]
MMAKRGGLGKGLDSLIPEGVMELTASGRSSDQKADTILKISLIEPNRDQPRKVFEEEPLLELAESIKQFGIIQPLVVTKKDNYYEIIAGERRWRAAKLAGLKEVPVIIKEYTDQEIMEISLIENIQREDLNAIEEAQAYQKLLKEFHLTQEEVARRVSKSRTAITNTMRLLKLDEKIQNMVIENEISSGHARALLAIEDKEVQHQTAQRIVSEQLSVRETEQMVRDLLNPEVKTSEEKKPVKKQLESELTAYREAEDKLKSILGTKVIIQKKDNNKGKIEIEYYSVEDLDRIIELMEKI